MGKDKAIIGVDYSSGTDFMSDEYYICIRSNSCVRWLVGKRACYYVFRSKVGDKYNTYFKKSKLLDELLEIYWNLPEEERNSYVDKTTTKAE